MKNVTNIAVLTVAVTAALFTLTSQARADNPPQWLQDAAKLVSPTYEIKGVPAVVLRNEEVDSVDANGTITYTHRYAIRILVREGRTKAIADVGYNTLDGKVDDLSAWLIRRNGQNKSYGKKETIDITQAENELYDEARAKLISAKDDADEGDVFGFESVSEVNTIFSQTEFDFQQNIPVLYSSFTLNLPAGWKAEGLTFNRAKVEPTINGTTYAWELRDLPPIPPEAGSPNSSSMVPRLAVSFFPAQATSTPFKAVANWGDVARWLSEIEDPQMTVDDNLAGKARELTANAKTELDRIRAIGRYVQNIQYIAVGIGIESGGGLRPHPSTEVFAKSYGDCKDKANLMRAMLSAVGVTAYMVSIAADDPDYVRAEWASPIQFNHCIIAIKVSDGTNVPSIVVHPVLGRLLIFDATDPMTPVGDLPEDEQGSLAIIDSKDTTAPLRMPVMSADMNRLDRNVDVSLMPDGTIAGTVHEKTIGQPAALERGALRGLSASDYHNMIEAWISRGATGARTTKIEPKDDQNNGSYDLNVEFSANNYAQLMQGRLMVFKPAVVGRLERMDFSEGKRYNPYVIEANSYSETVKIKLPAGFTVDEMPDPTKLDAAFGSYVSSCVVNGDYLIFTRSLKLSRSMVPADQYDTVRKFFGTIREAEQSPVVLMKKA